MLLGVYAYFIEHKQRNTLIWLPTDGDAENFMKTHVEPTIRDIPSLLALAPWYGKKHRDNTLTMKRFSNGRGFWCLGGKAAKNYREKSVDVAGYDELAAFDEDIEQEGSPTFLGDKRIEGSVWPKSIRGSTPKVRGTCQIERAASESPHFMRFHVACPHCGEEQYLKFGDKETPFGLKWTPDDPSSVFYLCEHNACVIRQQELDFTDARYICEKTGIWTRDGILWFSSSGEEIEPPDSVTFHIWTAYSPFTTWVQIVKDWMKTKGDTGKRKTFVNTTLGETWEAKIGERPDAEVMAERKEHYSAPVIEWLDSQGAFNHPYWMCKGSWSYGNNKIITDTGCGNIHLAGAVIEVMGIKSAMTIRITTPTTSSGGGTTNALFTYINHGTDYSPGWRRDYNSRNKPTASEIGALPSGGTAVSSVNLASKGRVPFRLVMP